MLSDKIGPYCANFADFLLIASNIAGGGPKVRLSHFKPALLQFSKPVMITIQIVKSWGETIESFSDKMQAQEVNNVAFQLTEDAGGVIIFPDESSFEDFQQFLVEEGYETISTEKPTLN